MWAGARRTTASCSRTSTWSSWASSTRPPSPTISTSSWRNGARAGWGWRCGRWMHRARPRPGRARGLHPAEPRQLGRVLETAQGPQELRFRNIMLDREATLDLGPLRLRAPDARAAAPASLAAAPERRPPAALLHRGGRRYRPLRRGDGPRVRDRRRHRHRQCPGRPYRHRRPPDRPARGRSADAPGSGDRGTGASARAARGHDRGRGRGAGGRLAAAAGRPLPPYPRGRPDPARARRTGWRSSSWAGEGERRSTAGPWIAGPLDRRDVLLVFGAAIRRSGKPSPVLRRRLEAAVEAGKRAKDPLYVVSGAAAGDGPPEAMVMRQTLLEHGVPRARSAWTR